MQRDITYTVDGMFTRFYPETDAGKKAWNAMNTPETPNACIPTMHLKNVLSQLRIAGYSVGKAKPVKVSDDELLAALAF